MTSAIEISGNTYPYATSLRRLGLQWDSSRKVWYGTPSAEIKDGFFFGRRGGRDLIVKVVGERAASIPSVDTLCPRCHTYCYGDCIASR